MREPEVAPCPAGGELENMIIIMKKENTDYIQAQPGWVFVGIYADEGISGTSLEHRKGMQQLIEDCKAGKIDLVLTKSIARFARNIVDCLSVIELLKNLNLIAAKSSVWHWFA